MSTSESRETGGKISKLFRGFSLLNLSGSVRVLRTGFRTLGGRTFQGNVSLIVGFDGNRALETSLKIDQNSSSGHRASFFPESPSRSVDHSPGLFILDRFPRLRRRWNDFSGLRVQIDPYAGLMLSRGRGGCFFIRQRRGLGIARHFGNAFLVCRGARGIRALVCLDWCGDFQIRLRLGRLPTYHQATYGDAKNCREYRAKKNQNFSVHEIIIGTKRKNRNYESHQQFLSPETLTVFACNLKNSGHPLDPLNPYKSG